MYVPLYWQALRELISTADDPTACLIGQIEFTKANQLGKALLKVSPTQDMCIYKRGDSGAIELLYFCKEVSWYTLQ